MSLRKKKKTFLSFFSFYNAQKMIFQIERSNRKTISIQVRQDQSILVRAPMRISESSIERLLRAKERWILEKQKIFAQKKWPPKKKFLPGEEFWYLGIKYPLQESRGTKKIKFEDAFFISPENIPQAKKLFIAWYKSEAFRVVTDRATHYSKKFDIPYKSIKITSAGSRWGSCTVKGGLNFPYRLVMTPLSVIDYVVVHELAHICHHNHSQKFWEKVKSMMPDYEIYKNYLKENSREFEI